MLDAATAALSALREWTAPAIETALKASLVDGLGRKPRQAFGPVRVAVTGRTVSPPLYESMELLGRDRSLARLRAARGRRGMSPPGPPAPRGSPRPRSGNPRRRAGSRRLRPVGTRRRRAGTRRSGTRSRSWYPPPQAWYPPAPWPKPPKPLPHDVPQPFLHVMAPARGAGGDPAGDLFFAAVYAVAAFLSTAVVFIALLPTGHSWICGLSEEDLGDPRVLLVTNASLMIAIPVVWLTWLTVHQMGIGSSASVLGRLRWRLFLPWSLAAVATLGLVIVASFGVDAAFGARFAARRRTSAGWSSWWC